MACEQKGSDELMKGMASERTSEFFDLGRDCSRCFWFHRHGQKACI